MNAACANTSCASTNLRARIKILPTLAQAHLLFLLCHAG